MGGTTSSVSPSYGTTNIGGRTFLDLSTEQALVDAILKSDQVVWDQIFSFGRDLQVKHLRLRARQLTAVPESVHVLPLNVLRITLNPKLTRLPDNLFLTSSTLTVIDLHGNGLTMIPDTIGRLATSLRILNISKNALQSLPDPVCSLTSLKALYAQYNRLAELPDRWSAMKSLQTLAVHGNRLRRLPETLGRLRRARNLTTIITDGNPLQKPPQAIVKTDDDARTVLWYLATVPKLQRQIDMFSLCYKRHRQSPTVFVDPNRVLASVPDWLFRLICEYLWSTRRQTRPCHRGKRKRRRK